MRTRSRTVAAIFAGLATAVVLVIAPAAPAQAVVQNCSPGQVISTCIDIGEGYPDKFWSFAQIWSEESQVEVAVNDIRIQKYISGSWVNINSTLIGDYDGYHPTYDEGGSLQFECGGRGYSIRGAAHIYYRTTSGSTRHDWTIYSPKMWCW